MGLGTSLSNGFSGGEIGIDGEASLSRVAAGAIGSESEDTEGSIFVKSSSDCFCDESDDDEIDGGSVLVAGIGAITGSCFQGSSTCSLTESNAADTQRSEKYITNSGRKGSDFELGKSYA